METHVIMRNDAVEFVHVGTEKAAREKLEDLAEEYYQRCPGQWVTRESYRSMIYWHIHTPKNNLRPLLMDTVDKWTKGEL